MSGRSVFWLWAALILLMGSQCSTLGQQRSCESLSGVTLPHTRITSAQTVAAGAFTQPPNPDPPPPASSYKDVPAFCRVVAQLAPSADSDIKVEVWMPSSGWNGKYRGQGNGGFAGSIDYPGMGAAIKKAYATAGTDTGHSGSAVDARWALGHPEKVVDFGYRAIHEMTLTAKALTAAFYGTSPRHSYFASCSDGGREALMEAQRYPGDYDGILAGAPANYWTHLLTAAMWGVKVTALNPAGYIPSAKIHAISSAVLAACDAQDGLKDGILNDPTRCHFDPSVLLCKQGDSNDCLTAPQVAFLKQLYAGLQDSAGHRLFPGYSRGGEEGPGGWSVWITGSAPGHSLLALFGTGYFSNMVYGKADWDPKSFQLEQGLKAADAKTARALNAIDPHLTPFMQRGHKLILYHGWCDAAIPPTNTIDYYKSVVATMGRQQTERFVRLFMFPGVQHCAGGPGPDAFGQGGNTAEDDADHNIYSALERWVEKGIGPSRIIATRYVEDYKASSGVKMRRPVCAYPEIAKYKGTGDTNDPGSFECEPGSK